MRHSNCSDAGLMSSPPGLCDVFSEAGWTVVTRNREHCTKRDRLAKAWHGSRITVGR